MDPNYIILSQYYEIVELNGCRFFLFNTISYYYSCYYILMDMEIHTDLMYFGPIIKYVMDLVVPYITILVKTHGIPFL